MTVLFYVASGFPLLTESLLELSLLTSVAFLFLKNSSYYIFRFSLPIFVINLFLSYGFYFSHFVFGLPAFFILFRNAS